MGRTERMCMLELHSSQCQRMISQNSHYSHLDVIQRADVAIASFLTILAVRNLRNNLHIRERILKIVPKNAPNEQAVLVLSLIPKALEIAERILDTTLVECARNLIWIGKRALSTQNRIHQSLRAHMTRDWVFIFIMERVKEEKYRSDPTLLCINHCLTLPANDNRMHRSPN